MVHAIFAERVEAHVRVLQHGAVVAQVLGGKVEFPSLDDQLAELDEFLAAEPEVRDPHDQELRDALGLRGGR